MVCVWTQTDNKSIWKPFSLQRVLYARGMWQLHIDGKTAVFPLIKHRCYWSLVLNHPYQEANSLAYHPGDEGMDKYHASKDTGPRLNIKTVFSMYGDSHPNDKTVLRPFYLYIGNSYTVKTTSLYWVGRLGSILPSFCLLNSMICFTSKLYNFDWLFDTKTPIMHYPCRFGKGVKKTFVFNIKTSRILNHIKILPLRLYKLALTSAKYIHHI